MSLLQQAYLDLVLARAAWRAARDVEAQVAHWLVEGLAGPADLAGARSRTRASQQAQRRAQLHYNYCLRQRMAGGAGRAA